jgi:hypothetical protein
MRWRPARPVPRSRQRRLRKWPASRNPTNPPLVDTAHRTPHTAHSTPHTAHSTQHTLHPHRRASRHACGYRNSSSPPVATPCQRERSSWRCGLVRHHSPARYIEAAVSHEAGRRHLARSGHGLFMRYQPAACQKHSWTCMLCSSRPSTPRQHCDTARDAATSPTTANRTRQARQRTPQAFHPRLPRRRKMASRPSARPSTPAARPHPMPAPSRRSLLSAHACPPTPRRAQSRSRRRGKTPSLPSPATAGLCHPWPTD